LQNGNHRAPRIIDQMAPDGLVSEANHVGHREVLISAPDEMSAVS
jgi:DNA segregation ATPase FtsK/SpoIIIE-like protein